MPPDISPPQKDPEPDQGDPSRLLDSLLAKLRIPKNHLHRVIQRFRLESTRHALLDRVTSGTYGGAYFEGWLTEVGLLPAQEELHEFAEALQRRYLAGKLTWSDLNALVRRTLDVLPLERVDAIRCSYRTKFYQNARPPYITDYDRTSPPALNALANARDQTGDAPESLSRAIRADAVRLHDEVTSLEIYRPYQEEKRTEITVGLSRALLGLLLTCAIAGGVASYFLGYFPVVAAVMALGGLGAAVSSQRRLQESFDQDASILNITKYLRVPFSIRLAPYVGAIFAFVFLLVLTAGVLPADLLPSATPPEPVQPQTPAQGWQMLTSGPIASEVEYAKLLIYSFLAGFAERLVPDTLDRLVGKPK